MLQSRDAFGSWPSTNQDVESGRRPMEFAARSPGITTAVQSFLGGKGVRYLALFLAAGFALLFVTTVMSGSGRSSGAASQHQQAQNAFGTETTGTALSRYAFRESYERYNASSDSYRIAIISDKDKASKNAADKRWEADLMLGTLRRNRETGEYSVSWQETILLWSQLNEDGRAMELSELAYFNKKLLAFDDRTGLVVEIDIENKMAVPIHIMMEGDGHTNKGQKSEWATVRDGKLIFGSIGKEWTDNNGVVKNYNNQWVKTLDTEGRVEHLNWRPVYEKIRQATGTSYPGYTIHEAVCWNTEQRKLYFMPRRVSTEAYDDVADEARGSNTIISFDENLEKPCVSRLGPLELTHGFSSCKFVPFREHEVVTLRTMEYKGETKSFITVMNLDGKVLMPETLIGDVKFEGVEFI